MGRRPQQGAPVGAPGGGCGRGPPFSQGAAATAGQWCATVGNGPPPPVGGLEQEWKEFVLLVSSSAVADTRSLLQWRLPAPL